MVRCTISSSNCCIAQSRSAELGETIMFKFYLRWISEAFAEGFGLLAKLPPSALRHAIYPF
jgi:hypothetical protein